MVLIVVPAYCNVEALSSDQLGARPRNTCRGYYSG